MSPDMSSSPTGEADFEAESSLARWDIAGWSGRERVGAAWDNAVRESSFALLQNNILSGESWVTRDQLRIAIVVWSEKNTAGKTVKQLWVV